VLDPPLDSRPAPQQAHRSPAALHCAQRARPHRRDAAWSGCAGGRALGPCAHARAPWRAHAVGGGAGLAPGHQCTRATRPPALSPRPQHAPTRAALIIPSLLDVHTRK